jgi:hypothetical protein
MQPRDQRLNKTAPGRHHLNPLAGALDTSDSAKNPVERNRSVVVRSRIASGYDATLGRGALEPDHAMDDGRVEPAVVEYDVALLDRLIIANWFHSDHITVRNRGTHAASAHSQLDRKVAGEQLTRLLKKVGRL